MPEPTLKVGQIWQRIRDSKQVEITSLKTWHGSIDVHWRGHGYKGRGAVWDANFIGNYEFVSDSKEES